MPHHLVDLRVAPPAPLVRQLPRVARAGEHQPVPHHSPSSRLRSSRGCPIHPLPVAGQPGDRADGARREDEPVGVVRRPLGQLPGQEDRDRDAGQVVVGQRRVAGVAGDDHLVRDLPGDHVLGVGEVAVGEGGVDAHLVLAVRHRVQGLLGQAEPPLRLVVTGAVGTQDGWSGSVCRCGRSSASGMVADTGTL